MKRALLLAALALAAAPAAAQAPERPKLIVAISVDQFSADLFAQYRQHFNGGLRRLANGIVFPSSAPALRSIRSARAISTWR